MAAERGPADSNGVAQSRQRGRRGRGGEGPAEEGGEVGPIHLGRDGVAHLRDRAMEWAAGFGGGHRVAGKHYFPYVPPARLRLSGASK